MEAGDATIRQSQEEIPDIVRLLTELPDAGPDDIVRRVADVYADTMRIYGPAIVVYEAAVRATNRTNAFTIEMWRSDVSTPPKRPPEDMTKPCVTKQAPMVGTTSPFPVN